MTLEQTKNTAQVTGVLKNINGRTNGVEKEIKGKKADKFGNTHDCVGGEFELQVDANTIAIVGYFTAKTKTDPKTKKIVETPSYASLKTIHNHELNDTIEFRAKQGGIKVNEYYKGDSVDNLDLKTIVGFNARYISSVTAPSPENYKAAFEVEGYLQSLQVPEEDSQKGKITLLTIGYTGTGQIVTFDITSEGAQFFEANAELNQKLVVGGSYTLSESDAPAVVETGSSFGSRTVDENTSYAKFIVEFGEVVPTDVDNEEFIADIKKAQESYKTSLEGMKAAKAEKIASGNSTKGANTSGFKPQGGNAAPSAFGSGNVQKPQGAAFQQPAQQPATTNPFSNGSTSPF